MRVFDPKERDRVRERVLGLASADPRVVVGAVVGSLAYDEGDRWSDLDLTFGVAEGVPIRDVLDDWTRAIAGELDGTLLFERPHVQPPSADEAREMASKVERELRALTEAWREPG